ncbi:hypothetical protein FKW77_010276 [Venturia effusa]|uniref:Uncharacterized protein n=1 Tax=Venturia effusa TaxID=50376 RepID=A0A517L0E6_9PEZI|nr:hypothetical protein FKW77_010276 [Venturia effusa]
MKYSSAIALVAFTFSVSSLPADPVNEALKAIQANIPKVDLSKIPKAKDFIPNDLKKDVNKFENQLEKFPSMIGLKPGTAKISYVRRDEEVEETGNNEQSGDNHQSADEIEEADSSGVNELNVAAENGTTTGNEKKAKQEKKKKKGKKKGKKNQGEGKTKPPTTPTDPNAPPPPKKPKEPKVPKTPKTSTPPEQ